MNCRRSIMVASVSAVIAASPMLVWTSPQDPVADVVVQWGSPQPQPPPPASLVVVPEEVTVTKGGNVTFVLNGAAHGVVIYPVSRNTTRADITEDLCQGGPTVCTGPTANLQYLITDGKGDLIIDTGANPPENRVNFAPGRLLSSGIGVFLTGSTATAAGTQIQYRFEKTGRYLVICANRAHSLNDWMFGFVNVVGTKGNP
jgi:plastocyanin